MIQLQPLGQRLREWREANGLSVEEAAQRLHWKPGFIEQIECGTSVTPAVIDYIEALIATPNPDHDRIVDAAVAAIRAGLEQGCTVVQIVRPGTPDRGRVVVTIGDREDAPDPEWRIDL